MRAAFALAFSVLTLGTACEVITESGVKVQPPKASMDRVDLLHAPTANQTLAWACYEFLANDTYCQIAGWDSQPTDAQMLLSFDLVFSMENDNVNIPIPLVEILLGITVIEDENLGAVCISFCDPDDTECVPGVNQEGACSMDDDTVDVEEAEDLIPTVDDLVALANDLSDGDIDNGEWRVIPPGESVEAHIGFDLAVDTTYHLAQTLLTDAVDDALAGRDVRLEVPYSVDGTVFFDVPDLGRYAIGFGPFEDVWPIQ